MTYHPRFEAGGSLHPISVRRSARQFQPQTEVSPGEARGPGTIPQRSADPELRLAHAHLARLFPDESFSHGCIAADRWTAMGLLVVLVALLTIIVARSIF
jgi:hypothetical protein